MTSSELSRDLIVYDGECLMCSSFVNFVVRHDRKKRFGLVTAQSALGRSLYVKAGLSPDAMQTNLTIVNGQTPCEARRIRSCNERDRLALENSCSDLSGPNTSQRFSP
jgi:predicted DCC family thiol-disulfide oxidoreductase YuxK